MSASYQVSAAGTRRPLGPLQLHAAELVAGVEALRHRVEAGRWKSVAQPQALQASARAPGLGDTGGKDADVGLTAAAIHVAAGSGTTGCPPEPSMRCDTMLR